MAFAQSVSTVSNESLLTDFVVKHTFIGLPKAPSLRRVSSDAAIRYSDYTDYEKSSQCSLASVETASQVTDDDHLSSIETSSTCTDFDFDDSSSLTSLLSSLAMDLDVKAAQKMFEAQKALEAADMALCQAAQLNAWLPQVAPVTVWVPVCMTTLACPPPATVEKMEVPMPLHEGCEGSTSPRTPKPSTTLVMRNIPRDYTRAMLIDLLDIEGFKGLYNFVYLPIGFEDQTNICGYGIINLVDSEGATGFLAHFSEFSRWSVKSDKVCEVSWSGKLSGLDAHIELYRNSPVLHTSVPDVCKPALFKDGERVAFPDPTKRIRAPRKGRCIRAQAAN